MLVAMAIAAGAAIFAVRRIAQDHVETAVEREPAAALTGASPAAPTMAATDRAAEPIHVGPKNPTQSSDESVVVPLPSPEPGQSSAPLAPIDRADLPDSNATSRPRLHEAEPALPTPDAGAPGPGAPPIKAPSSRAAASITTPRTPRTSSRNPKSKPEPERKRDESASGASSTLARSDVGQTGVPATPANPDRWARMEMDMAACAKENLFVRLFCEQRVRFKHCDGYWGVVPQCPGARQSDYSP